MANDHYISRFLTKPWEIDQRVLRYYDFETHQFGERSSESLFAKDGLHLAETGKLLNQFVETPISQYRASVLTNGPGSSLVPSNEWKLYRALAALTFLHALREPDSAHKGTVTLDRMLSPGEAIVDELGRKASEGFDLIGVTTPSREQLLFSERMIFPIPIVGTKPILAFPLTPSHFIGLAEKKFPESELRQWMATEGALSAFSTGANEPRRVVLTPSWAAHSRSDPKSVEGVLVLFQSNAHSLFNLVGQACLLSGLPAFSVSGRGH